MKLNNIYHDLQDCFIKIRHYSFTNSFDLVLLEKTINKIKNYERYIVNNQLQNEHTILLYCINTLLGIIDENDKKKICAFADTIHNIPEIYIGKRNIESFSFEIKEFCDKYGKEYFAEIYEGSNTQVKTNNGIEFVHPFQKEVVAVNGHHFFFLLRLAENL